MTRCAAVRLGPVAVAMLALSACAGKPGAAWYETPQGVTAANGAKVSLSQNAPTAANAPDGDTRVTKVDGLPVGPSSWDEVVLPPGVHRLDVVYNGAGSQAEATFSAMLQAGAAYQVKGARDGACDAMLWLQEQGSGQVIGQKFEAHLTAKPIASGAPPFSVACN